MKGGPVMACELVKKLNQFEKEGEKIEYFQLYIEIDGKISIPVKCVFKNDNRILKSYAIEKK